LFILQGKEKTKLIQTVLGFFGYCKIPKGVISLSMEQERFLEIISRREETPVGKRIFEKYLNGQKAITEFLRSGRLLL